jgi:hypothetical protein
MGKARAGSRRVGLGLLAGGDHVSCGQHLHEGGSVPGIVRGVKLQAPEGRWKHPGDAQIKLGKLGSGRGPIGVPWSPAGFGFTLGGETNGNRTGL